MEFLKHASHIYSEMSEQAKRDLQFLCPPALPLGLSAAETTEKRGGAPPPGKDAPKEEPHYAPGTNADWIVPYVNEFLMEYKRIIDGRRIRWKDRIPFFKHYPIGVRIVLSQYKGVMLFFMKKSSRIEFLTWSLPVHGNFKVNDQNFNLRDSDHLRVRTDDDRETIWKVVCGSEDLVFFSTDRAREDAQFFADEDIIFYSPSPSRKR